ncbi:hypothetical protein PFICI_09963 [Pestalotiopsis fici W106-1]|uniref:Zn(2)-C6 fungal-type domain-containing protein n=1 Tax=Pestalotiopsis fici (strain W106-1 / CGMCC3.15140) TaxID=1229662 RepID=W3WYD6_PESFW|nr:uncharacterized protein PFICI_09963 [Pestalotiopsis fici W106-1]ETS77901.1 hypothetical protein PFICI_09963 [Pestalotiopsis fici W106-1]
MASAVTSFPAGKQPYACIRCAARKVKCDRNSPCAACTRHQVECVFNLAHPPRNRHKRGQQQALKDRIKQYEALLLEKGIDPERLPDTSSDHGAPSTFTRLDSDFDPQESKDTSHYKYANK